VRLRAVRWAIEATCREVDPRPLNQIVRRTLRGSRQLLREAAGLLGRTLRRERRGAERSAGAAEPSGREAAALAAEERLLSGVLDRLAAALWHQEGYRLHLEQRLAAALAAAGAGTRPDGGA
jgi:hypothetical protein